MWEGVERFKWRKNRERLRKDREARAKYSENEKDEVIHKMKKEREGQRMFGERRRERGRVT